MASVISGDANVSATEFGYLDGVTSALQTQMDAKLPIAGGKILQIVRATDGSLRQTTSTSFVDATGSSVTITPQKSDSAILLVWSLFAFISAAANGHRARYQLTDSSNNAISGAEDQYVGSANNTEQLQTAVTLWGYSTPATTSATTYKGRFCTTNASSSAELLGNLRTTSLYAIEVSA